MTTHFTKLEKLSTSELKKMAAEYSPVNADLIEEGYFDNNQTMLIRFIVQSPKYMKNFKGSDFMNLMKFTANLK